LPKDFQHLAPLVIHWLPADEMSALATPVSALVTLLISSSHLHPELTTAPVACW